MYKYFLQALRGVPAVRNIGTLVPDMLVSIFEWRWDPEVSFKGDERKKCLYIYLGDIEVVGFVLEKKRVNRCLVDLAAEAVAKELEHNGCIKKLKIPKTLMDDVFVKFKDCEWIRRHCEFFEEEESLLLDSTSDADHEDDEEACSGQHKEREEILPDILEIEEFRDSTMDSVHWAIYGFVILLAYICSV